jgi:hypothetical protein
MAPPQHASIRRDSKTIASSRSAEPGSVFGGTIMPTSTTDMLCKGRIACTGESWECGLTELRNTPHGTPIPDAGSPGQSALESEFLEVIGKCDPDRWQPHTLPFLITSVIPRPDELIVRIPDDYLPDVICDLMPKWLDDEDDNEVSGIPGLRADVRRESGKVRLHRPGLPGCISIPRTANRWHKALLVAGDLLSHKSREGLQLPWLTGQPEWTDTEIAFVEQYPRWYGTASWQYRNSLFASQILRRLPGLCADPRAYFHDMWFNRFGDTCQIQFEWADGPTHKAAIDLLLDPVFGPGAEIDLFDGQSLEDCMSDSEYRVNVRSIQQPATSISLRRMLRGSRETDPALLRMLNTRASQRAAIEARYGY